MGPLPGCAFWPGLGIGPGDEVITVSHTVNATVSSILFTGRQPDLRDIEPDTYLIDAARIERAISPRTRAGSTRSTCTASSPTWT